MNLFACANFVYSIALLLSIVLGKKGLFCSFWGIPCANFVYSLSTRAGFPHIDKLATLYIYTICRRLLKGKIKTK